jgi:uncharacterized repeat protein (TIGR03833 family)
MDTCRRSSIYKGQLVSIVLKADQGTDRRTIGTVADILSPGDFHPRGIKVRLKDGSVGRVQEILPEPETGRSVVPKLMILVVQRPDMRFYARKLMLDSGDEITALGLDTLLGKGAAPNQVIDTLFKKVKNKTDTPICLFEEPIEMNGQDIHLAVYMCSGVDVKDDTRDDWSWTGWLSITEIETLLMQYKLSPESMRIAESIVS